MNTPLFPLWCVDRLRMDTDGTGVTALVTAHGCPLNCKYCINPQNRGGNDPFSFITPDELYEKVRQDSLYYISTGGGIAFGGGEPLLSTDFIYEFRKIVPKEWKFYAETSLYIPAKNVEIAARCIDSFFVDIKNSNPDIYRNYTGKDIAPVIDNLILLNKLVGNRRITVRIPHIPDFNTDSDVDATLCFLRSLGLSEFDVFNYKIPNKISRSS